MELNSINISDNIEYLRKLPDNSVDAIITDSPYGLGKKQNLIKILQAWLTTGYLEINGSGFMGKKWDAFVPQPILWKECLRVLKPGGYLLSFFGTRTYHLGSLAIELAGFEIRDCIQWIYGSGFPKSKACLKPANEPICVARKLGPLQMLGIDEARIEINIFKDKNYLEGGDKILNAKAGRSILFKTLGAKSNPYHNKAGRWPANVIIDEAISDLVDSQSGKRTNSKKQDITPGSNFFYNVKVSQSERAGMTHPTIKPVKLMVHLIKLYCPSGGIVVDPHFGSGATGEACLETGRYFIGIDNDIVSVKEANERIERWHKRQTKQLLLIPKEIKTISN